MRVLEGMDIDRALWAVTERRKALTRAIAAQNADPERGISALDLALERRLYRLAVRLRARAENLGRPIGAPYGESS